MQKKSRLHVYCSLESFKNLAVGFKRIKNWMENISYLEQKEKYIYVFFFFLWESYNFSGQDYGHDWEEMKTSLRQHRTELESLELKGKLQTLIHPTDLHTLTLHSFGFKLCCVFRLMSLSCNPFVLAQTSLSHFPCTEHVILIFKTWSFHAISSDLPALKNFEIK